MYDYREQLDLKTTLTTDTRRIRDKRDSTVSGENVDLTLTLEGLADVAEGRDWRGRRMLEVGPKYGIHTRWIDEQLAPSFIAFSDFEEDRELHGQWESELHAPHAWVFGDLRHATALREHGPFDLVFFLGVLYHSAFHLELLGMLNRVTRLGGEMVLETTIDPRPDSAVRVRWQPGTGKAKLVPTFDALRIELAWTGWRDVTLFSDYRPASNEVLLGAGRRTTSPMARTSSRWSGPSGARPGRREPAPPAGGHARRDRPRRRRDLGNARTAARRADRLRRRAHPLGRVALARGRRWALGARRRLRVRPALSRAARPCASAGVDGSGGLSVGADARRAHPRARRRSRVLPRPPAAFARLEPRVRGADRRRAVRALHGLRDDGVGRVRRVRARLPRDRPLPRTPERRRTTPRVGRSRPRSRGPVPARGARGRARDRARATRPVDAARRPAGVARLLAPHRGARGRCGGARRARRARQPTRGLRRPLALLRSGGGHALGCGARSPAWRSISPSCPSWSRRRLSESSGARAEQAIERPRRSSRCS